MSTCYYTKNYVYMVASYAMPSMRLSLQLSQETRSYYTSATTVSADDVRCRLTGRGESWPALLGVSLREALVTRSCIRRSISTRFRW